MLFDIESFDYSYYDEGSEGLKVALVHHLDMPIMRQTGFHIAPGTENQVRIVWKKHFDQQGSSTIRGSRLGVVSAGVRVNLGQTRFLRECFFLGSFKICVSAWYLKSLTTWAPWSPITGTLCIFTLVSN